MLLKGSLANDPQLLSGELPIQQGPSLAFSGRGLQVLKGTLKLGRAPVIAQDSGCCESSRVVALRSLQLLVVRENGPAVVPFQNFC